MLCIHHDILIALRVDELTLGQLYDAFKCTGVLPLVVNKLPIVERYQGRTPVEWLQQDISGAVGITCGDLDPNISPDRSRTLCLVGVLEPAGMGDIARELGALVVVFPSLSSLGLDPLLKIRTLINEYGWRGKATAIELLAQSYPGPT